MNAEEQAPINRPAATDVDSPERAFRLLGFTFVPVAVVTAVVSGLLLALGPNESLERPLWFIGITLGLAVAFLLPTSRAREHFPVGTDLADVLAMTLPPFTLALAILRFDGPSPAAYLSLVVISVTFLALCWVQGSRCPRVPERVAAPLVIGSCLISVMLFLPDGGLSLDLLIFSVLVAVFAVIGYELSRRRAGYTNGYLRYSWIGDLLVVTLVLLIVPQFPDLASSPSLLHHQNFFLGPVNDLSAGDALLSGTWSQYGVGVFYVLKAWFTVFPIGYGQMALLLILLTTMATLALYAALRLSGVQKTLAFFSVTLVVVVQVFAQLDSYVAFPSTGALRFWGPLGIILVSLLNIAHPGRMWLTGRFVLIALAAVWSLETFAYTAFTFVAIEAIVQMRSGGRWFLRTAKAVTMMLLVAVGTILSLSSLTVLVSGSVEWGPYLEFILQYTSEGLGTAPFVWFTTAGLVAVGVFISTFWIVVISLGRIKGISERSAVGIGGFTAAGIIEFTYFLGISVPNNLRHLAPILIAIATIWLSVVTQPVQRPFGKKFVTVCLTVYFFAAGLLLFNDFPSVKVKWKDTALALATPGGSGSLRYKVSTYWRNPEINERASEGARLLQRARNPVVVIAGNALSAEILLRAKSRNALGSTYLPQDLIVPALRREVNGSLEGLKAGDLALVADGSVPMDPIGDSWMIRALRKLPQRFKLRELESSRSGLSLVRLGRRGDSAPGQSGMP